MYHPPKRALVAIRLSRVTDASTSPERQLADCEQPYAERGHTVTGKVKDQASAPRQKFVT